VTVFERERSLGTATRNGRLEIELNRSASFLQLLDSRELRRDEPKRQTPAIDRERHVTKHARGVRSLLGDRDRAVTVGVDRREHDRKDVAARR
jgi:hypothetical protein